MLYASFSILNPWHKHYTNKKDFRNLFVQHGPLCTNKHWELECIRDKQRILSGEFSLSLRGRDHAGLEIGIGILGIDLAFRIYDIRHWDHKSDCWERNKGEEIDLVSQINPPKPPKPPE